MIIRSNGEPTYFAADIGYVTEKFSRGFDHLIYIWGADHHGTVARVRNAAEAMGYDRERRPDAALLVGPLRPRRRQEVSMSKRAGEFITLDELLAEVGVDAARWFFASRGATTAIDFDIELAKKQSNENPVYYVQYAHARIASILRKAAEAGLAPAAASQGALAGAPEAALARAVARFPEVVEDAVAAEETQGITAYATELATTFHAFYRDARVVDAGDPGAIGRPARARRRDADHAGQRARACSGSPRPSRCRRAGRRSDAGRAEDHVEREQRRPRRGDQDRDRACRPAPRSAPGWPGRRSPAGRRRANSVASAARVPGRSR